MTSGSLFVTVATCVSVLVAGCGGAAPERQPATSPADVPAAAPGAHAAPTTTEPAGPGAPPPAPAPAPPPPPPPAPSAFTPEEPRDRETRRDAARKDLEKAEKELLDLAASSCESACRALASMERATTLLCTVADDAGDQRRCEDARRRLVAARTHVRSVCGSCS